MVQCKIQLWGVCVCMCVSNQRFSRQYGSEFTILTKKFLRFCLYLLKWLLFDNSSYNSLLGTTTYLNRIFSLQSNNRSLFDQSLKFSVFLKELVEFIAEKIDYLQDILYSTETWMEKLAVLIDAFFILFSSAFFLQIVELCNLLFWPS